MQRYKKLNYTKENEGGYFMKMLNLKNAGILSMLSVTALILNSCAVEGTAFGYDDIYADTQEMAFQDENLARQEQKNIYQDPRFAHQSKTYREPLNQNYDPQNDTVLNQDFDMDDYYDYAYTARLHRFHDPAPIYNYYDDWYTNLYWYDRDPLFWGTSIYTGYRWWYPSVSFSWGWGWSPWRYSWYGDWYGWHHGWYDYAWGWYGGPHHCGWGHHAPWYYNSHDRNSNFYRPDYGDGRIGRPNGNANNLNRPGYRGEPNTNNNTTTTSSGRTITRANASNGTTAASSFGEKYINRYGNNTVTRSTRTSSLQKPVTSARNTTGSVTRYQKPVTRTVNPDRKITNTNNQRRTYTPAAQRQQRNTNIYRNTNTNRNTMRSTSNNRSISAPSTRSTSRSSSVSSGSRSTSGHSGGSVSRGGSRR